MSSKLECFQVEALAYSAQLHVEIAADELQRHFLAGVAGGVVDFAEAALAHAPANGEAGQRARAAGIEEPARRRRSRHLRRPVHRARRRRVIAGFQGSHLLPTRTNPHIVPLATIAENHSVGRKWRAAKSEIRSSKSEC